VFTERVHPAISQGPRSSVNLCEELWVQNLKVILGWGIVVVVGAVMFMNALFMLASPRAWFRLPGWIRAQGTLTEQKYASGWGSVTVRLTGAVMLAVIGWVLYDSLIRG
jgi:hypothetical protein